MTAGDLITRDRQIEWRGLLLGAGTAYGWQKLTGWRDRSLRTGDTDRTGRHGEYPGQALASGRTITWEFVTHRARTPDVAAALELLDYTTATSENSDEEPLVIRERGKTQMVMARCLRTDLPDELDHGDQAQFGTLQWKATNPRKLQLPKLDPDFGLPTPSGGGLAFPLAFPARFGSGKAGGELIVTNQGNSEAWPVWRMTGPVPGPGIVNADTGESLLFNPAWTLPANQTLEIDTDARTVLIVDSNGNSTNVSRSDRLFTREWFPLLPRVPTRIRFTSVGGSDPAARLRCLFHHTDL